LHRNAGKHGIGSYGTELSLDLSVQVVYATRTTNTALPFSYFHP